MGIGKAGKYLETLLAKRAAAQQGFEISRFDRWHPELDEALASLPENRLCTHKLFRRLMTNPGPTRKRSFLVTKNDDPVAVAGLRQRADYWQPVTTWIVPGALFPVKDGLTSLVLPALGVDLRVGWWRFDNPPPEIEGAREIQSTPRYGMSCSEDFESYWRETRHFKNIRKCRNRCSEFLLEVDSEGLAEWTLRKWEEKWYKGEGEMPDLADRLEVVKYLEERGQYHTLTLMDKERPVASATLVVHDNEVVGQYMYRDPEYDWHGVMTRLIELVFFWAKDTGYTKLDMGGVQGYKRHWAPKSGKRWEFRVCPDSLLMAKRVAKVISKIRSKVPLGAQALVICATDGTGFANNIPICF